MRSSPLLIVILSATLVAGCSPKFACKDVVNGEPRCNSVSAMYNIRMRGAEDPAEKAKEKVKESSNESVQVAKADQRTPADLGVNIVKGMVPSVSVPVRMPPKIIRIWVAPWEDSDGDLHQPGHIFSEINDKHGRWLYGEKETVGGQPMLKPIERILDKESISKGGRASERSAKEEKKDINPKQNVVPPLKLQK